MTRPTISRLAAVAVLVLAMASLVPAQTTRPVIVAGGVDATSMDPYLSTNITDKNVVSHIYDTLLQRDQEMRVQPHLATAYRAISPTEWEFVLRRGTRFENGQELTARDVVWTLRHALDPDLKAPSVAQFRPITEVRAVDDYTVRFTTSAPYPALPAVMSEFWVMSAAYGTENEQRVLNERPMGTGPYRLVRWNRGEYALLEARTDYWAGAPAIRQIQFQAVPDQNTRLVQLQTGEADIVAALPIEAAEVIRRSGNARVETAAGARAYFVSLNMRPDTPLRDLRVRQALNQAVNVEELIRFVYGGLGKPLASLLTPEQFGYTATVQPWGYDPERARQLLREAGYPNGFRIRMEAPEGRYPKDREVAQAIAGQLAQVGIDVDLSIREWGGFIGQFRTEDGPPMFYLGWSIPTFDPDSILTPLLTPNQTYGRFHEATMSELINQARVEVDAARRAALYAQVQQSMKDQAPMIFLYQLDDIYGVSNRVNWSPRSDERVLLTQATLR